jgi:hypothetical protein
MFHHFVVCVDLYCCVVPMLPTGDEMTKCAELQKYVEEGESYLLDCSVTPETSLGSIRAFV